MRSLPRQTVMVDEEQQQTMLKIGDVAKLSGIGIEALRFYEKSGLLDKPARTYSGYRVYSRDVLERLAFIKQAQALGFSLAEIRRIVDDARMGHSPCDEVREIVRRRLAEVEERISELKRYRKSIAVTLEEWDRVGQAPGHICGLIEGAHVEHTASVGKKLNRKKRNK
ncbi:MAG: heavy metal-responsive transcriptional regulator [Pyrinomonadaceae bacterium]|nr:heavy metal-responsive transcriptional regulator [Pyrinomonadaceae bacterium]